LGIHYITGRSGSGKTMQVYREIREALDQGGSRLILMVPEQFTLQAERDLIHKLNLPGLMDVEVLSFSRLAHKVFNEVGGLTRIHINDQGKHMILRKLLDGLRDRLTIYKTLSGQNGFIEKINDLLTDFKKHDITPEMLRQKASELKSSGLLSAKLQDTALIYEAFNNYLQDRYIDSEDAINSLIDRMESDDCRFLFGARIWMDGFDYITPQTARIIEKLAVLAQDLTITFTIGTGDGSRDQDLFRVHELSMQKVRRIAKEHLMKERFTHLAAPKDSDRFSKKAPEILFLERELYQYPYRAYVDKVQNIELFAANNPESEIESLAARIVSLSREKGWRYKEMAVVSGGMDHYSSTIKRVFEEYGIPYFLDEKRPVIENPIVDMVLISLRVVERGYRYEDVFKLLKTGFCGLSVDETELLENYCLEFGIKGKRWQEPLTLGESDYPLDKLNHCRQRFIQPCLSLEKGLKRAKTIEEMIKALYEYLTEIRLQHQLEVWIEELRKMGHLVQANENAQIWNIVMETLDQLVGILGDQKVSIAELSRILESGFTSLEVGIIPTTLDQVLVGNIQRSKSQDVKALFVVGCNDGILPSGLQEEGLLAADERDLLYSQGLDLGGSTELLAADEKFGIYTAFSKPSDFLWISYAISDSEGKALRPSILVDRMKKLFKRLNLSSDLLMGEAEWQKLVATPESTFKHMVSHMRDWVDGKEKSALWWEVYSWYFAHEEWEQKRQALLEGLFHKNQEAPIGREKAMELYSVPVRASVSRLEQYVNCPFSHFVKYGLRPRERKMYTVAAPDLGELFHLSIEGFTKRITEEQLDWRTLDDTQCEAMLEEIMDKILPEHNNGVLLSTNRYKYLSNRLKRISKRAVWLLTDHIRRSSFNPMGNEISFGAKGTYPPIEVQLPDGERMLLEGRIDRADVYQQEDSVYLNVIDYKSGVESFDLSDAYYGLKLQLLVYLEALLEAEQRRIDGKARPGGIFYFRIDDPLIDTREQVAEAIQAEIRKKLKLNGLVLKDVNIVRCMDCNINGHSEVLPVGVKKDGSFYAYSSVLEEEEFFKLLGHVRRLIQDIGVEMLQGNIRIEPVKKGKQTACKFCPYDGICQFDNQLEDNGFRFIRKMDSEEVVKKLIEESAEGGMGHGEMDSGTTGGN
jgi:ATP-dependent helicase/nuclease subunit B